MSLKKLYQSIASCSTILKIPRGEKLYTILLIARVSPRFHLSAVGVPTKAPPSGLVTNGTITLTAVGTTLFAGRQDVGMKYQSWQGLFNGVFRSVETPTDKRGSLLVYFYRSVKTPTDKRGSFSYQFPVGAACGLDNRSSLFTPFFLDTDSVSFPKFQVSASTAARRGLVTVVVLIKFGLMVTVSKSRFFS